MGITGPTVGEGLLPNATQRVMVRRDQADAARRALDEALDEGDRNAEPETANSRYLEQAAGRRGPRNYTVFGAYARAILWSAAAFALVAAAFLLLRL